MINQIKQLADWQTLTSQAIADALAEIVLRPGSFESFNTVTIAVGNDVMLAETMVGAMRAMGLHSSADSLISRTIDFGMPSLQAMIDVLATNAPDTFTVPIVVILKNLGKQTRWAEFGGIGDVPIAADVTTAIATDAANTRQSTRTASINDAMDSVRNSVDLTDAALTLSDMQTAVNNALAAEWSI